MILKHTIVCGNISVLDKENSYLGRSGLKGTCFDFYFKSAVTVKGSCRLIPAVFPIIPDEGVFILQQYATVEASRLKTHDSLLSAALCARTGCGTLAQIIW